MLRVLILLTLLISNNSYSAIGKITEEKGSAEIVRNKSKLDTKLNLGIESLDNVQTAKGVIGITFQDDTKVRVTEHSKLIIDDFVYDPKAKGAGKLAMKVALGTVRYASGNIAKENNKNVDVKTPTATIAVRGTAFTMTVDEIGGSTIILLPNLDGSVGEIEVRTAMGSVVLNRAFQATVTLVAEAKPMRPVILNLTESMIDNMLIVKPPKEIIRALVEENNGGFNALNFNELDKNELDMPVFKEELKFDELNINDLDAEYLNNALENAFANNFKPGFNSLTNTYIIDKNTHWVVERRIRDTVTLNIDKEKGYELTIIQPDNVVVTLRNQDITTNKIYIRQGSR